MSELELEPMSDSWCQFCWAELDQSLCPFYPKDAKNGAVDVILSSGNTLHNLKMIRCEREGYGIDVKNVDTENNTVFFLYNRPVAKLEGGSAAAMGYVPRTVQIPIRNIVAVMSAPTYADVAEAGEKERNPE